MSLVYVFTENVMYEDVVTTEVRLTKFSAFLVARDYFKRWLSLEHIPYSEHYDAIFNATHRELQEKIPNTKDLWMDVLFDWMQEDVLCLSPIGHTFEIRTINAGYGMVQCTQV